MDRLLWRFTLAAVAGLVLLTGLVLAAGGASGTVVFEEASQAVGIEMKLAGEVHGGEEDEWPAFPEIMGSGACWADVDGDGFDDLYVVNQAYNELNPSTEGWIDTVDPHNHLYLNQGDGTFREVAEARGVASRAWGYGCTLADYDGDGDLDLYVANFGANELFENQGDGWFSNVTAQAGVDSQGLCAPHRCMSTATAWADYDGDGDLDLYVGNYVDTARDDLARSPGGHKGQINQLYRNNGDGTFTDVAAEAGVQGNPTNFQGSKTLGVIWFDHDLDGDLDLYVANDEVPNDFYENQGDGTFVEISDESGAADDRGSMGITAGDYDKDGYEDLFFTHYQSEENGFYRNLGDGTFEDRSGEDDLTDSLVYVGWGTAFSDLDKDGDLDLLVTNGHTEDGGFESYGQATQVYEQEPEADPDGPGDVAWVNVSEDSGSGVDQEKVTRGMALGDPDLDGDPDVVLVNNANQTIQYLQGSNVSNHWLYIRLAQPGMNPDAIGARVTVEAGDLSQMLSVRAGASYLSQNTQMLTFGLGETTQADQITVTWPDGATSTYQDVAGDNLVRLERATGAVAEDVLSPLTELLADGQVIEGGWFTPETALGISAVDRGLAVTSGLATTEHRVDGGPWTEDDGEPLALGEGVHTVEMRSTDQAGNTEPVRRVELGIDGTPPTASHELGGKQGEAGWFVSDNVTVTLTGEDGFSGVAELRYRIDGGPWAPYEGPFTVTGEGTHAVAYQALDTAGNEGNVEHVEIAIDSLPPAVEITAPPAGAVLLGDQALANVHHGPTVVVTGPELAGLSGWQVSTEGTGEDATSGLQALAILLDGETSAQRDASPVTWAWDTRDEELGRHNLTVVARDVAGNEANAELTIVLAHLDPGASPGASPGTGGTAELLGLAAPPLLLGLIHLPRLRDRQLRP